MDGALDHLITSRLIEIVEFSKQVIILILCFLLFQITYPYNFECDSMEGGVVAHAFNVKI